MLISGGVLQDAYADNPDIDFDVIDLDNEDNIEVPANIPASKVDEWIDNHANEVEERIVEIEKTYHHVY